MYSDVRSEFYLIFNEFKDCPTNLSLSDLAFAIQKLPTNSPQPEVQAACEAENCVKFP